MKEILKSNKKSLFLCTLAFVGEIIGEISWAFLFKLVFDIITGDGRLNFTQLILFAVLITLARGVLTILSEKAMEKTAVEITKEYKHRLLNTYIETDSGKTSSEILNLVTHTTTEVEQLYLRPFLLIIKYSIFFIGSLCAIFYFKKIVVLIVLALSWLPLIAPKLMGKKNEEKRSKSVKQNEYYISKIKEVTEGFDIIKAFHIENKIKKLVGKQNDINENLRYTANSYQILVNNLAGMVSIGVFMALQLINAGLVIKGFLTVGSMMAITQIFNYVAIPIQMIPRFSAQMKGIKGKISENDEFLKLEWEDKGTKDFDLDEKIQIKDLSFSYGDKLVLSNLNMSIKKGEKIAVVGESGSGKSTLAKIILKRLRDYSGEIHVDENDYKNISVEDFYKKVSPVSQEVFLFNDSLKENIALYSDVSDEKVQKAIEDAGLVPVVQGLKDGVDTLLGEYGVGLSGGEKQRISIARCLIKDSQLIVMDEATSALDIVNARNIEQLLLDLSQTVLVITHRIDPEILKQYDRIYVLREGKIIESGKFEKLNYFNNEN
ncbi:MAG: ABC transporter ATP-binding protein [Lagierella massiliensis]|nr:ABC transporter ATP-binding protein [Lagierella massiliensis]